MGGLSSNLSIEFSQCSCKGVAHGLTKNKHSSSQQEIVAYHHHFVFDVQLLWVGITSGSAMEDLEGAGTAFLLEGACPDWEMYIRNGGI